MTFLVAPTYQQFEDWALALGKNPKDPNFVTFIESVGIRAVKGRRWRESEDELIVLNYWLLSLDFAQLVAAILIPLGCPREEVDLKLKLA